MAKVRSPKPKTLGPAIRRALDAVERSGGPALVDVVTQPTLEMHMRTFIPSRYGLCIASQTPSGTPRTAKKIFDTYGCYQCHDHDGKGGAGARLAPKPIPFAAFTTYVRKPAGEMPPYTSKVVSDQELADIYAFLESIPAPPASKAFRC